MITTTPLPAFEPYKDDAAAPFTTSIDSISSTFISANDPCTCTPSTIIRGVWFPSILVAPRRFILEPEPGEPLNDVILTPAIFPESAEETEDCGTLLISSALILVTDTDIFLLEVPAATPAIITSSNILDEGSIFTCKKV